MKNIVERDTPDALDQIPDPLIVAIFNNISDIKTLICCRCVNKRFNSLVPYADSLILRVDRVISTTEPDDEDSFLFTLLKSIFKSFHDLLSHKPLPTQTQSQNSPSRILVRFQKIRHLHIELPSSDLKLEKGTVIRWKAEFGESLKTCIVLAFCGKADEEGLSGGLKRRVVWTISALIAASSRHYMVKDVVRENKCLENLVVRDKEGEGVIVMGKDGLGEYRESGELDVRVNRTKVPAVRMRMRHEPLLELENGVVLEGATFVVVRPAGGGALGTEAEEQSGDGELARGAFGGVFEEAVRKLLKNRSYVLEMNSF